MDKVKNIMIAGCWDESRQDLLEYAYNLARELSSKGYNIITGGGEGIPYYCNKGVNSVNGFNISFLNEGIGVDKENDTYKVVKFNVHTEMGWDGRSVLAVKSCDCLVVLGGANGTLNEITLAYLNKIPIFILKESSELIKRFKKFLINGKYIDERRNIEIVFFEKSDNLCNFIKNVG